MVTGSAGFIGRAVMNDLRLHGHRALAFDLPRDIRDRVDVHRALSKVDAVINLAGVLGTAETIGREIKAAQVNIIGALNILDAAEKYGTIVVQIATGHEGQLNPYAVTKQAATSLALIRAKYGDQRVNVVRGFHCYGPGQKAPAPHGPSTVRKIIPSFVCRALDGMPLEIYGSGDQVVDMVYVDDVAAVLRMALEPPYGRVLDAGTGHGVTVRQVADDVIEHTRSHSWIVRLPMRPGEPSDAVVIAKEPLCSNLWPYGLDTTIDHYRREIAL